MMVTELLPGKTLQAWALRSDDDLRLASELLIQGISLMHGVTDEMRREAVLGSLPNRPLLDDLYALANKGGDWLGLAEIQRAVSRLEKAINEIDTPLVFSNGDYQPTNFLSDGHVLTGLLDFEKAAFVDPLSILARFPVYDLSPISRSGFIEKMLASQNYNLRDFALRVAVFALRTLQTKLQISGGTANEVARREHVRAVLDDAMVLVD